MNEKICPLLMASPTDFPPECLGKRCALSINRWNPSGDQVTCSQDICALTMIALTLATNSGEDVML